MRALIVGGGIAGLSLAVLLRESGHEVVVMERRRDLQTAGYMIDFFGPGYDAAERMQLVPGLAAIHYPIRRLVFVDRHGHVNAELSYPRLRKVMFADRHFNFMRGELESLLYERLLRSGGSVLFGTGPECLESSHSRVAIRDSNGSHDSFDLVIGADGIHSRVRHIAFSPDDWRLLALGCHTAAYTLPGTLPGLIADAFVSMSGAGITVGAYPIRGDRTATFFVYRASAPPGERSPAACRRELERAFRGAGWIVDALLDGFPASTDVYFDAVVQVEARRWHQGRVVLIGDACGCPSLIAGQGASMAMAGAFVLAEEIHRSTGDLESALTRYESRMRPAVEARQRAGRRNARWFLPRSQLGARLRDYATALAVNTPLARLFGRMLGADSLPLGLPS